MHVIFQKRAKHLKIWAKIKKKKKKKRKFFEKGQMIVCYYGMR